MFTSIKCAAATPSRRRTEEVPLELPTGRPLNGSDRKEFTRNAGYMRSLPGWGRSPGEKNGNLLRYSCLENFIDRGAWWVMVHGVAESDMTE